MAKQKCELHAALLELDAALDGIMNLVSKSRKKILELLIADCQNQIDKTTPYAKEKEVEEEPEEEKSEKEEETETETETEKEDNIKIVMQQTACNRETAERVLKKHQNIVDAILELTP